MNKFGILFKKFEAKLLNKYISHNLDFYIGNSKGDLDDVYKLRYQVYCEEQQYIDKNQFYSKMEVDEYDKYSVHFLIRDREGNLLATARLILSSSIGFPLEKNFKLFFDAKKIPRNELAEISRLIVVSEFRQQTLMLLLVKGMYNYVKQNRLNYLYSVMDESLTPRLGKLGFPFHKIGNTAPYQGMTTPYIIDVNEFSQVVKEKNPVVWNYIADTLQLQKINSITNTNDSLVGNLMKNYK